MSKPRTGAPKRVAVGLLAGALATFGVALAPNAGATTTVTTDRVAGATRYGTAAAVAGESAFGTPSSVIIATGENFPDALAASTLSGSFTNPAPILLTQTSVLSQETSAGLDTLRGKGVTTAQIVGGTNAVSTAVEQAIAAKGFTITRIAGTDRFETAAAIANAANARQPSGSIAGNKTALIATGENFPDALAGGPIAVRNDLPLLLVNSAGVPASTEAALRSLGITRTIILGGTAVVSDATAARLQAITGNASQRLAGVNRFGTAAAVGDFEITTLGFPATVAVLATGTNFPDALAAGPLAGLLGAPIVLVQSNPPGASSLPEESRAFLDARSNTIARILVIGGTAVIDDATVAAAQAAAQTVANDQGAGNQTVTRRPELVSAAIVGTVSQTAGTFQNPQGTTVAYTFDEPVTGAAPVAANFHVYRATAPNTVISPTTTNGVAPTATVSTTNNRVVNVLFPNLFTTDANATTGTAGITLATVDLGAVTGNGTPGTTVPDTNPEGDAPLTSNGTGSAVTAGTTTAPDLVSVGRFGLPTVAGTNRLVDFTFDQAAFVQSTTSFHLVFTDGVTDVTCTTPLAASTNTTNPGGGSAPGGNGTTTITVDCPAPAAGALAGQPASATNVARGYVDIGAVGTTTQVAGGGVTNPLEASNTPHASSGSPDLVSVTFSAGTGTQTVDTAIYTFDEPVTNTGLVAANFRVYNANGIETAGTGTVTRNVDNTAQVSVSFPLGSLANAVGGSVRAGAVTAAGGLNLPNLPDEQGAAAAASTTTTTPGSTTGPDLTGVIINTTNNAFGQAASVSVVYLFDTNISAADPSRLFIYLADGSRAVCGFAALTAQNAAIPANAAVCSNAAPSPGFSFVGGQAGTNTGFATTEQIRSAVLGTADNGAVTGAGTAAGLQNPEGAAVAGGTTGTPQS